MSKFYISFLLLLLDKDKTLPKLYYYMIYKISLYNVPLRFRLSFNLKFKSWSFIF